MKKERFWEIDFIRGLAIILVIIFHILIDLNFFDIYKINVFSGFLLPIAYTVATTFLLLVGISVSLSFSKSKKTRSKKEGYRKILFHGLIIFGFGLLITLATWLYLGDGFVIFGVLHCIGVSIIFSIPFLQFRFVNVFLGVIFIVIGIFLRTFTVDFNWFLWLGFKPNVFYTVDYYPLLPWFGVVLIGIVIGNYFYPECKRKFKIADMSRFKFVRFICFLGRNTLAVYLIHQPIIVGILHIFFMNG